MRPEPIYQQIGKIIRARRRALERAQEVLAHEIGISRATLANIETGRQRILVHQLYKFAKALNLKLSDLLPGQASPAAAEWSGAPIEGDLSAEQMKQVANFIGQVETQPSKRTDGTDGKTSTRLTRGPGAKTAR